MTLKTRKSDTHPPKALVLRCAGTNCDLETQFALNKAGAQAKRVHINQLIRQEISLKSYALLVIPGGFSYGDDISAGKILANELRSRLDRKIHEFVSSGRLVIGICNGFQVLAKLGLLPNLGDQRDQTVSLAANTSSRFQCEWVGLKRDKSAKAQWLSDLPEKFEWPIAHAEGRFVTKNSRIAEQLEEDGHVFLRYYPANPNGSESSIAGITNETGNVIGLMPHPERFIYREQHPCWTRELIREPTPGLMFWQAAVQESAQWAN